jgi:hypothetical protein
MKKFFLQLTSILFFSQAFAYDPNAIIPSDIILQNENIPKTSLQENDANQSTLQVLTREDDNRAQKTLTSKLSTKLVFETKFNDNYQTTNRIDEYKEAAAKLRLVNKFQFTDIVSLNSNLLFTSIDSNSEVTRNSRNGGNSYFENIGVVIRELNLALDYKKYAVVAGKFNLNFGKAWMWNRGLWIHDLANNYRQVEKLGFAGIYRLGDAKKTGQYNFSFSAFTNDRKNLDNAWMTNRDSSNKSDAVPGDTRSLQSYNAALDINFDFSEREKLTYHFAYLNMAINKSSSQVVPNKIDDQKSFVLSMNYRRPIFEKMLIDGLLEYEETKNLRGNSDLSEKYFTANLITKFDEHWSVLFGNSNRKYLQLGANGYDQNLSEVSLGYEFAKTSFFDRLTIQVGYKNLRTNYKTSVDARNGAGLLLRYYKNF